MNAEYPQLTSNFYYLMNMRQCTLFYQLMFHRHMRRMYPHHTTPEALNAVYAVLKYKTQTEPRDSLFWKNIRGIHMGNN